MTNPTSNFGWQMPTSTDLVTDLPADFEVFGQAVDTSLADLKGGTTGQVLSKATNADMDFTWVAQDDSNAIQNSIVDAKGDLIAATANDTPARLAVGTNGHVLTADSTTATGLKWAAAAGGGKVLQVVNFTNSLQADSTSTSQTTVITATITPSATTSKILVLSNLAGCAMLTSGTNDWGEGNMTRNAGAASWNLADRICQGMFTSGGSQPVGGFTCFTARLDEPASTSVVTYLLRFFRGNGSGTFRINSNNAVSSVTLIEIGA